MDLYRYFHPHHNPRLRCTALRLQELAELEQAAIELSKAVKRAQIRSSRAPIAAADEQAFAPIMESAQSLVQCLSELTKAHPGDDLDTMKQLLRERRDAPGWETWSRLLRQRLELIQECEPFVPPQRFQPAQPLEDEEETVSQNQADNVVPLRKVQNR